MVFIPSSTSSSTTLSSTSFSAFFAFFAFGNSVFCNSATDLSELILASLRVELRVTRAPNLGFGFSFPSSSTTRRFLGAIEEKLFAFSLSQTLSHSLSKNLYNAHSASVSVCVTVRRCVSIYFHFPAPNLCTTTTIW